ncbi:helix-hairpin-helix domain-containing protein [Caldanaerobius polysaccharolyticus]|uniref:helix-hairpin-helix domain-containing protein n=1 Tax=Caldanaerobius polysaccharolyticus TaxID=44256 RepID=UPI002ADE3A54|nr:helix-hairpin-helix domain-containing protein [Caldanaerobius polysaccharolyticus]
MSRRVLYVIIALLSFSLLGSLMLNYNLHKQVDQIIITADSVPSSVSESKGENAVSRKDNAIPKEIYVDVSGAVKNPGVYKFKQGDRIIDAVNRAGGLMADADTSQVNLAKKLADEEKVYIPKKGEKLPQPAANVSTVGGETPAEGKININTASLQELDTLPGIGPVIAQRIIDYRNQNGPFKSIEEIKNVSRIGDKLYEQIKDKITAQ